jgi:CysZ protein
MLRDLAKSFLQLEDSITRRYLWKSLLIAILLYFLLSVFLWKILVIFLTPLAQNWSFLQPFIAMLEIFGIFGGFLLALFFFPATMVAISGLFIEQIIERTENIYHYTKDIKIRNLTILENIKSSIRLFLLGIFVNIIALPVYILWFGFNIPIFFLVNGFLISQDYGYSLLLRYYNHEQSRALLKKYRWPLLWRGGVLALLLLIPLINILVPTLGAIYFTHYYHRHLKPQQNFTPTPVA